MRGTASLQNHLFQITIDNQMLQRVLELHVVTRIVMACERRFVETIRANGLAGSAVSMLPTTTRPWTPSSPYCKRTSSTGANGPVFEPLLLAIVTWIEITYHQRRRQARLGRLTPIQLPPSNGKPSRAMTAIAA